MSDNRISNKESAKSSRYNLVRKALTPNLPINQPISLNLALLFLHEVYILMIQMTQMQFSSAFAQ
jgi:hypothetical protein